MTIDNRILKEIISRLEKLEHAVLVSRTKRAKAEVADDKKYSGATGGIRLLVREGYFDKKRFFGEICTALATKGYHYSKQAVQTPLNSLSATKRGPLVALKEKGKKLYAKRK